MSAMYTTPALALLACQHPEATKPTGPAPTWYDRAVGDNVLARVFDRTGDGSGRVTCVAPDEPGEVHTVRGPDPIVLYGLLADTEYHCVLRSGRHRERRSFRTDPLPDWLPTWTMAVAGDAGGAYTLFNHGTDRRGAETRLLIVDPEGRLRWYHSVPYDAPGLDASWLGEGRILYGGGYAAPPTVIDLSGHVWMDAPVAPGQEYHHDTERLATGEFLGLSESINTDGDRTWLGGRIDLFDAELSGSIWSWDTQRGFDEGWLPPPKRRADPYHANALQAVDDQLYVNFRHVSILARMDLATGDLVWRLGPDGDFALVDEAGAPADPLDWFEGPHAPSRDGDRILMYDNRAHHPSRQSRAVEFEIDEVAMTARVVWEFTEEGWYERIWGDADRLPSGNVLITRAHCASCTPAMDGRTQLVEVDPSTNEVVWRLVMDAPEDVGYRAERIDGCAIFANARYCDE